MASTTVDATLQGYIGYTLSAPLMNWVGSVRNSTTGTAITITSNGINSSAIRAYLVSGRAGYVGHCQRVFLFFDDLDIATGGGTITAATLKVYGSGTATSTDTIVVKASAWGGGGDSTTLASGDFDSLDHSTAYAAKDLSWSGTYNDFTLNASAISDMNTNGYLNCAVIEGDYDYDGQGPTVGTDVTAGVEFLDATNPIKLELTYTAAGYPHDVIGVDSSNIIKVTGVPTGNIARVIGVNIA